MKEIAIRGVKVNCGFQDLTKPEAALVRSDYGAEETDKLVCALTQEAKRSKYPGANLGKDQRSRGVGSTRRSCPALGKTATSEADGCAARA